MNFMGMGLPEVLVIMVVAFLALGPSKSIDMARTTGKMIRDLRRTFNEITSAITLDEDDQRPTGSRPNNQTKPNSDDPSSTASRQ